MKTASELTAKVFEFLNENSVNVVLRNYNGLPHNNTSRDIDILIEKEQFLKIEKEIISFIEDFKFKLVSLYRSEKVITYVCASSSNGLTDLVQFDFFFNTSLFGVLLIDAKRILKDRLYNGAIYHVSKEYEFLDKYLQLKFLNKSYPQKYQALREEMIQSDLLPTLLQELTGTSSLEALESMSSFKFKSVVFFRNLKTKPIVQLTLLVEFIYYFIKNIVFYKGLSIGFTGPDGSGKTTVIDAIVANLNKVYTAIQLFHFRPTIIPNLGEAAHKTKLKSTVDIDYSNPHRGEKTGKLNSLIRLLYYSVDYIFGYFLKVRPQLRKRSIVIFDRYFTDIIADSRRSRIHLKPQFLYWFGKLLIPKLDYNILLTADRDIILKPKQELTAEGIDTINKKLDYLKEKQGYYLVLNNESPKEAVQKILTLVFEEQHKKNIKRIGY